MRQVPAMMGDHYLWKLFYLIEVEVSNAGVAKIVITQIGTFLSELPIFNSFEPNWNLIATELSRF